MEIILWALVQKAHANVLVDYPVVKSCCSWPYPLAIQQTVHVALSDHTYMYPYPNVSAGSENENENPPLYQSPHTCTCSADYFYPFIGIPSFMYSIHLACW